MQAIVLAGGLGTRLRARVADLPKAMAPIGGRPFLEYLLDRLDAAGFRSVVLATGHLSERIEAHFGLRYRGLALSYSRESRPLGTGGAVLQALRAMPDHPTLVLNGDTWLDLDLGAFLRWCDVQPAADAMVLRPLLDVARFGSVVLEGDRVVAFGEKARTGPGLVNAGIYRLRRATFDAFEPPAVFSIENDFFHRHARALRMRGFVTNGNFIDIGVPEDYDRAQREIPRWTGTA